MNKKVFVILIVLICVLSISTVSANGISSTEMVEKTVSSSGSFTELQNLINADNNTIELTNDYTYSEKDGENGIGTIIINKNLTINGNGHTIDASNKTSIFNITKDSRVTINNITFINGNSTDGGAIYNNGILSLCGCEFINNNATNHGGVIYNLGSLTVVDSSFINNTVVKQGGVFFNLGSLTVVDSSFINNHVVEDLHAGVCYNKGSLTVIGSTFINNTASYGGVIYSMGSLTVVDSSFINNTALNSGGAITSNNNGLTVVTNSSFINNFAVTNSGGAIHELRGSLTVIDSSFINNSADYRGGAIYAPKTVIVVNSSFINNSADSDGGAIYDGGDLNVSDSSFINNSVDSDGGAIYDRGDLNVIDSGFINNSAGDDGGAIYNFGTLTNVNNSTFINNSATHNGGAVNGKNVVVVDSIFNDNSANNKGGAISGSNVDADNSTFTNNTAGVDGEAVNGKVNAGNSTFDGNKLKTNMNVIATVSGFNVTINVTMNIDGLVSLTVGDKKYNVTVTGGKGSKVISNLPGGKYTADVEFAGNENYTDAVASTEFNIKKIVSNMNITVVPGVFNATINVTLNTDGNVKIIIDNRNFTVVVKDGVGSTVVSNLKPANYTVDAVFEGNDYYNVTNATGSVTIVKQNATVSVSVDNGIYGDHIKGNLTLVGVNGTGLNGTVTIIVDGVEYEKHVTGDNCSFEYDIILPAGDHVVTVKFNGDESYNLAENSTIFNIAKFNTAISVVVNNMSCMENITGTITFNDVKVNGTVKIVINGKSYNITAVNGIGAINLANNLIGGEYDVNVTYAGNQNYSAAVGNTTFIVEKITTEITCNISVNGTDATIKVDTNANGTVSITVDETTRNVTIKDGSAVLNLNDLAVGNHTVVVTYPGNEYYNENTTSEIFEIQRKKLIITADPVMEFFGDNETFVIKVTDDEGNPLEGIAVKIEINGITYNRTTDSKGLAVKPIDLPVGFYKVNVCFKGNSNYTPTTVSSNITIKTTIVGQNIIKIFKNGTQFSAAFLDSEGNLLKDSNVSFNINGISYYKLTNASAGASLNINLAPGTYILTAFNSVTGELRSFNVTVLSTIQSEDLNISTSNRTPFVATLLDDHGLPAKDVEATFNINGVLYHKVSDANGMIKLNITLQAGEYIITTYYGDLAKSNNIIVREETEVESVI